MLSIRPIRPITSYALGPEVGVSFREPQQDSPLTAAPSDPMLLLFDLTLLKIQGIRAICMKMPMFSCFLVPGGGMSVSPGRGRP